MSYASQQFVFADSSTLATFKSWAQAISNGFAAMGWTQTTDTGQVNWSTIAAPPAVGAFVYEIWQPGDALQTGSTKFFIKVWYGTSSGSPHGPRFQMQGSTSTDGAGNLNGITSTNWEMTAGGVNGTGTVLGIYLMYLSGDTNRFGMLFYGNGGGNGFPMAFVVERTHNTDGTDSSDGFVMVAMGNTSNNKSMQTMVFGVGAAPSTPNGTWVYLNDGNTSMSFNGDVAISPMFPSYGKFGNPMFGAGFVHSSDIAELCLFQTTLYGATRTYVCSANFSNISGLRFCMRFD